MFKQLFTLFRAASHNAAEEITDRHALLILQQQMRDGAKAVEAARKAVAVAIAHNEQEKAHCERLRKQIEDLETRAIAALETNKSDLAQEAAETIATLETEHKDSEEAQATFSKEIQRLRTNVLTAETRLKDLRRGQRIATATDKAHRIRQDVPGSGLSTLVEAEETLNRLRARQQHIDATEDALNTFSQSVDPEKVAEKLAEAGCGPAIKTSADDVLARLKSRLTASEK
ncbi:MAG: PspA/IM30 family protein [Pseudomonadota bacterium]